MTGTLEQLLIELEVATAALNHARLDNTHVDDTQKTRAMLKRRSKAIGLIAELNTAELTQNERAEAIQRLIRAARDGEDALQRLRTSKHRSAATWSRWNQILLALGATRRGRPPALDVRG